MVKFSNALAAFEMQFTISSSRTGVDFDRLFLQEMKLDDISTSLVAVSMAVIGSVVFLEQVKFT